MGLGTSLKRHCAMAFAFLLLFAAGSSAQTFSIQVYGSVAPNGFSSSSFAGYANNAIFGLQNGLSAVGDLNQPTFYAQTSTVASGRNLIVTDFPSWLGQANPGAVFGPQYANETGNRLHFGVHISSPDTPFSLSQLNYAFSSNVGGGLDLNFSGSFTAGDSYGTLGSGSIVLGRTAGGQLIDSGSATQLVTDLWYTGVGNGFEVLSSDPGATDQEKIDNMLAANPSILDPFVITGTYWLTNAAGGLGGDLSPRGSANVVVNPVPEPSTWVMAAAGVVCLTVFRRRSGAASALRSLCRTA